MDETLPVDKPIPEDEAIDVVPDDETLETVNPSLDTIINTAVRTLDGEIAGDEFAREAVNYQILLGKIDTLLEHLRLDA